MKCHPWELLVGEISQNFCSSVRHYMIKDQMSAGSFRVEISEDWHIRKGFIEEVGLELHFFFNFNF